MGVVLSSSDGGMRCKPIVWAMPYIEYNMLPRLSL